MSEMTVEQTTELVRLRTKVSELLGEYKDHRLEILQMSGMGSEMDRGRAKGKVKAYEWVIKDLEDLLATSLKAQP